jgi:hypothetical protein
MNLSVGDDSRPFLHEPSPPARLLDWLAWRHHLLFIVSAGNHDVELPSECSDNAQALRFAFETTRHRRILSPAETLNGLTVGALNLDHAPQDEGAGRRSIPQRTSLPAIYSGRKLSTANAPWVRAVGAKSGHRVALAGAPGKPQYTWRFGTSNAAALASRSASIVYEAVEALQQRDDATRLATVPPAVIVKALLAHTAQWPEDTIDFVQTALDDVLVPGRAKDQLSALLGYSVVRPDEHSKARRSARPPWVAAPW